MQIGAQVMLIKVLVHVSVNAVEIFKIFFGVVFRTIYKVNWSTGPLGRLLHFEVQKKL